MSGPRYPRKGHFEPRPTWPIAAHGPKCAVCGTPAGGLLHIKVNWFRGDDEVIKVCAPSAHTVEEVLTAQTTPRIPA